MGVKISNLPSIRTSSSVPTITGAEVLPLVQSGTTYKCSVSGLGGVVLNPSLSSLTIRDFNYPKTNAGTGSVDLQYAGNSAVQSVTGVYSATLGGRNNANHASYSVVVGGSGNYIPNSSSNSVTLGSSLNAVLPNFTYVNNISSQGVVTGTVSGANFISSFATLNTASYMLVDSDGSKTLIDSYSTDTKIRVPANATVPFTVGAQLVIVQGNKNSSNYTIISADGGVTINSFNSSLTAGGNFAAMTLIKAATDTWYLIGNLK